MAMTVRAIQRLAVLSLIFFGHSEGCEFNGVDYPDGASISGICPTITCEDDEWVTNGYINEDCGQCRLTDDPHIETFDSYYYDWHGTCNYSIAQLEFSEDAEYGVYGKFTDCGLVYGWGGYGGTFTFPPPSCSDITTFKNDDHTAIEMRKFEDSMIWVNDQEFDLSFSPKIVTSLDLSDNTQYHPVFAWRDGTCLIVVGSQGLTIEKCTGQIMVWAHPSLLTKLNGLCGHYNNDVSDDFTDRSQTVLPLEFEPFDFPDSWETEIFAGQENATCENMTSVPTPTPGIPPGLASRRRGREDGFPIFIPSACNVLLMSQVDAIIDQCRDAFEGMKNGDPLVDAVVTYQLQSCLADICMIKGMGLDNSIVDTWFAQMEAIIEIAINKAEKTTRGGLPPNSEVDSEVHTEHHSEDCDRDHLSVRQSLELHIP